MARELKNLDRSAGWQAFVRTRRQGSSHGEDPQPLDLAALEPFAATSAVADCGSTNGQFLPLSLVPPLPQLHHRAWARLHLHHHSRQNGASIGALLPLEPPPVAPPPLAPPLSRHLPHHRVYWMTPPSIAPGGPPPPHATGTAAAAAANPRGATSGAPGGQTSAMASSVALIRGTIWESLAAASPLLDAR